MLEAEGQRRHVVLLVDDELRTTRRMADMLREDGFAVEIARDGAAAVARLSRTPVPDALVTELTTAYADGLALGRFARKQRPGIPVLVLTGYPNLFHADAFADGPPATLFTKPVDYAVLRSALHQALDTPSANEASLPAGEVAISADEALAAANEDASACSGLESPADDARRNALSGAQTLRALRRP